MSQYQNLSGIADSEDSIAMAPATILQQFHPAFEGYVYRPFYIQNKIWLPPLRSLLPEQ